MTMLFELLLSMGFSLCHKAFLLIISSSLLPHVSIGVSLSPRIARSYLQTVAAPIILSGHSLVSSSPRKSTIHHCIACIRSAVVYILSSFKFAHATPISVNCLRIWVYFPSSCT